MFAIKNLLSSGHSALFLQLHSWFRGWLNNFSVIGNSDGAYISAATIAQLHHIFIKDFKHFMMFWEMLVDQLEERLTNNCFPNF